jgi:hypothetical protein
VAGKEGLRSIKISDLSYFRRAKGDAVWKKQCYPGGCRIEMGARRMGKISKLH